MRKNGVIVLHDCNPLSEEMTRSNISYGHSSKIFKPSAPAMCGDVWKTIVHLRTYHNDLRIFVLNSNLGFGIITKGHSANQLDLSAQEIKKLKYKDLKENRKTYLNLKNYEFFEKFIQKLHIDSSNLLLKFGYLVVQKLMRLKFITKIFNKI